MVKRNSNSNLHNKLRLLWTNGKICGICGRKIKRFDEMTIDHIIPLSRGGNNKIDNCQLAHSACNAMKGNLIIKEDRELNRPLFEKWLTMGKCFVGFGVYLILVGGLAATI